MIGAGPQRPAAGGGGGLGPCTGASTAAVSLRTVISGGVSTADGGNRTGSSDARDSGSAKGLERPPRSQSCGLAKKPARTARSSVCGALLPQSGHCNPAQRRQLASGDAP
jgi:hypothetical protein